MHPKYAFTKQNEKAISYQRSNTKENLYFDLKQSGMFTALNNVEIETIASNIANSYDIGTDYTKLKQEAFKLALTKNQEKEENKQVRVAKKTKPLFEKNDLRIVFDKAIKEKKHIYDILKENGFVKNPVEELLAEELA